MRANRDPSTRLRQAIDALPVATRAAMLEGIGHQPVVTGGYTDGDGGACPMLAAHRAGSRVTFLPFHRAWDTFCGAQGPRRATRRERIALVAMLEASLYEAADVQDLAAAIEAHRTTRRAAGAPVDFASAIGEHQSSVRARYAREAGATDQPDLSTLLDAPAVEPDVLELVRS